MATSAQFDGQPGCGIQAPRVPQVRTVLRPPVDIYEDAEGITLHADIPGVSRERLSIQVDGTTLQVEGEARFGHTPRSDGSGPIVYRRSFELGSELETDRIDARVRDGVLSLRIPKRPASRPRKIAVQ